MAHSKGQVKDHYSDSISKLSHFLNQLDPKWVTVTVRAIGRSAGGPHKHQHRYYLTHFLMHISSVEPLNEHHLPTWTS